MLWISKPVAYEPGLTDSCTCFAYVEIESSPPRPQKLDDAEWSLQTICLPLSNLHKSLNDLVKSHPGLIIDSRLDAFAAGLRVQALFSGGNVRSM
ncbi:hypothetical protein BC936DRAFT_139886 [Jimgerdemannia flammicorona]|uniref:Uncharacterized protein n=2 Tax=Jimgerdemannia flammicorona TaxID=994334 RepID=A0A433DHA6_9FUNG|nr:hypothetical protein BC936DRAFT_139886 [Jimgerdemannia flammicorona]RUS30893.1 hypothetical protein BC938DRAFT_478798 [Jimgerdemannia flammicorona]